MRQLDRILVLSFVGARPETATELHKQLQEEIEKDTTLEEVTEHLTALASDHFIASATRDDGTPTYWR